MKIEEMIAILVALLLAILAIVNNSLLPTDVPTPPVPNTKVTVAEDAFIRVEATTLTEYSLDDPEVWVEPFKVFIKDPRVYSIFLDGRARDGSFQTDASFNLADSQGNLRENPFLLDGKRLRGIPFTLSHSGENYFDLYVKVIARESGKPDIDNGGKGLLVPLVFNVKESHESLGRVRAFAAHCGDFSPVCAVDRLREP